MREFDVILRRLLISVQFTTDVITARCVVYMKLECINSMQPFELEKYINDEIAATYSSAIQRTLCGLYAQSKRISCHRWVNRPSLTQKLLINASLVDGLD